MNIWYQIMTFKNGTLNGETEQLTQKTVFEQLYRLKFATIKSEKIIKINFNTCFIRLKVMKILSLKFMI